MNKFEMTRFAHIERVVAFNWNIFDSVGFYFLFHFELKQKNVNINVMLSGLDCGWFYKWCNVIIGRFTAMQKRQCHSVLYYHRDLVFVLSKNVLEEMMRAKKLRIDIKYGSKCLKYSREFVVLSNGEICGLPKNVTCSSAAYRIIDSKCFNIWKWHVYNIHTVQFMSEHMEKVINVNAICYCHIILKASAWATTQLNEAPHLAGWRKKEEEIQFQHEKLSMLRMCCGEVEYE